MNILYLTHRPGSGTGSGVYARQVINAMVKRHHVRLYTSPADLDSPWDVVHVLDLKHFDPRVRARITCPLLIDVHDYYWTQFYPFFTPDLPVRWLLQRYRQPRYARILQQADGVIVHSRYVAKAIGYPAAHQVRLGVDPAVLDAPLKQRLADTPPWIISVGRDYFRKGFIPLWQAFREVKKAIPAARLTIIGREFFHTRFVAKMLAAMTPQMEIINGLLPAEVIPWYHRASLFVLPSHIEAFGMTILEAMSAGVPVVATRVGGIPEIIESGKNGWLVPPNNPEALSRQIITLLQQVNLVEPVIHAARQTVRQQFTLDHTITDLEKVYKAYT